MYRSIHWLRRTDGQVLAISALSFSILLGFAALAVDTGALFRAKRQMQTAADSAAVAGTLDYLWNNDTTSAKTVAKSASSSNGFTDGTAGATVTVSIPPADGPNAGNSDYVEVVVQKPVNTFFMSLFGKSTVNVGARAVGAVPNIGSACIWAMSSNGTGLDLQGHYDIEAPGCGIYDNSNSGNAIQVTGNGGTLNAKYLDVVGHVPPGHITSPTPPTMGAAPRSSPWGNFDGATPTNGLCNSTDSSTTSLTGTVTGPGTNKAVCFTQAVTLNNATLGPGTYMFENGVTISGTDTVNGGTIDVYSGTFNQGNALLNVTAPTSGSYNGIAIMQPKSNTTQLQVQFGSGNQTLDGYIYAPGSQVYLQDHGGGITATGIVCDNLYDKASTIRIPSYDAAHPSTTLNRIVTLVE